MHSCMMKGLCVFTKTQSHLPKTHTEPTLIMSPNILADARKDTSRNHYFGKYPCCSQVKAPPERNTSHKCCEEKHSEGN